jgi:hypothetical protein
MSYATAERDAALGICRCMPYHLDHQPRLETHFSVITIWTMSTAWQTLRGVRTVEGRWIAELLKNSGRVFGAKAIWDIQRFAIDQTNTLNSF